MSASRPSAIGWGPLAPLATLPVAALAFLSWVAAQVQPPAWPWMLAAALWAALAIGLAALALAARLSRGHPAARPSIDVPVIIASLLDTGMGAAGLVVAAIQGTPRLLGLWGLAPATLADALLLASMTGGFLSFGVAMILMPPPRGRGGTLAVALAALGAGLAVVILLLFLQALQNPPIVS